MRATDKFTLSVAVNINRKQKNMNIEFTIERDRTVPVGPLGIATIDATECIALCVEFSVSRAFAATYYDPAEEAEIDIHSISDEDGAEIELTGAEAAQLEELIWASDLSDEDPRY